MKHARVCASLVLACGVALSCGSEDSDPPPVPVGLTPGAAGSAAGSSSSTGQGGGAGVTSGVDPTGNEGQAGAPIVPGTGGAPGDMSGAGAGNMTAAGAAGAPAAGAGGAGPTELTLDELVGGIDGHLFSVACGDTPAADDCNGEGWRSNGGPLNLCAGGRLDARIDFPIGGEPGALYDVAIHFYGVMEPRQYGNFVMREAAGRPSLAQGGTPTPFATMPAGAGSYLSTGDNNYNTYELHVLDEAGQEVRVHFLNADAQTGHYTFGINYEKTIELIGGGVLRLQIADANCRQIKNCGSGGIPCAGKAQEVDIAAADPQPLPGTLDQPGLGKDPEHSGQWFLMDALRFEAK